MKIPKKTKYRYNHYPKYEGHAKGNQELITDNFSDLGLQADQKGEGTYVSSNQIEAARKVISPFIKKDGGKMWIRIFPHWGKTKKPLEVRMGSGKGSVEKWEASVKKGTIVFEIWVKEKKNLPKAREVLEQAAYKLPKKKGTQWKVIERNE